MQDVFLSLILDFHQFIRYLIKSSFAYSALRLTVLHSLIFSLNQSLQGAYLLVEILIFIFFVELRALLNLNVSH